MATRPHRGPPHQCPFCGDDRLTDWDGRSWFCAVCARTWIAVEHAPPTREDAAGTTIAQARDD